MVRCDVEGVTGVVSFDQAEPGKCEYAFGQTMFMADLLALLDGLRAGGAEQVVIYDEHYYGRNIDLGRLPDFASAICGKPPYRKTWSGGVDATFDGVILLGFHAKAHTPGALLPHSYELETTDIRLNGVSVGEIGVEAAVAGDHEVPVIMITGDSAGVEEAQRVLPGIRGVVVKEAITETGALCYPLSTTIEKIRSAAESVATHPPDVKPYVVGAPVTLDIEFAQSNYLTAIRKLFANQMPCDSVLHIDGESSTDVWGKYWNMKLRAQALMNQDS